MGKKKILSGFIIFMGFMWLCTLISKSVYTTRLPMVSTVSPEEKYVEHIVEADGIVVEGGKKAVTSLGGLRVKELLVHTGDRVEEGEVLFRIDLEDLKEIMGEKQAQIDKLQLQINAILENQELARQKKELEEARAREDYDTTAREKDTDVGRAMDKYSRAAEDLEGAGEEGMDEEGSQALKDALQSAAYDEADAMRERDHAMKQAQREIEDILFPDGADATLSVTRREKTELKEGMSLYQQILNAQGDVTAESSGMITDIYIEVGGRIPDSAAVMMTDERIPCQFKVILDKDQKKYIGYGDEISIKMDGSRANLETVVEYFSESQSLPGCFEIFVDLPEDAAKSWQVPGLSGKLSHAEPGEKQACCIPSSSVYYTTDGRTYVYVLSEREGILGQEYYVEERSVKVLDQNENWTAVEPGVLDGESRIITSADKQFGKGDVVRWIE